MEKKIEWKDVKEGDKLKVVGTYWRSDNDSQEDENFVTAKIKDGKKHLYLEDGKEFFHGVNSSYEYFLVDSVPPPQAQ